LSGLQGLRLFKWIAKIRKLENFISKFRFLFLLANHLDHHKVATAVHSWVTAAIFRGVMC
jgi:hypothetical protein